MSFKTNSLVNLNSGYTIPKIGFGVLLIKPSETVETVLTALEVGYRHIDCAKYYNNERDVVEGILRFLEKPGQTVKREEIFYTTKIWNLDLWLARKNDTSAIDAALEKTVWIF